MPSKEPLIHRPRRRVRAARLALSLGAAALAVAGGCRRDEVTHFRVPKASGGPALGRTGGPTGSATPPPGMAGDVPPPPTPSGASALKWTLPRGWTQDVAGGMRYATLRPPVSGRIDVSVVVLPGPAGGELANVNRWRGQIGLPPVDEAALAGLKRTLATRAGSISVYDFVSEGNEKSRMVAALAAAEGSTWFIKMVGGAEPVGAARADFMRLLESLHP